MGSVDSLSVRIDAFLTNAIESDGGLLVHPSPDAACRVRAKLWFAPGDTANVSSVRSDPRGECYRPGQDKLTRGERFEFAQTLLTNVPLASPPDGSAPMLELYAQCWQNNCVEVVDGGDDCEFEPTCESPDDQFAERSFSVYFERNLRVGRPATLSRAGSSDALYQFFISYEWRSPFDAPAAPFRDRTRNASIDDFFPFTYGSTTTTMLTSAIADDTSTAPESTAAVAPTSFVDGAQQQFSTDALIIAGISVGALVLLLAIAAGVTCYVRKHCVNRHSLRRARADANAVAMVPYDIASMPPPPQQQLQQLPRKSSATMSPAHIRLPAALERHPSQVPLMHSPGREEPSIYDANTATMNFATAIDIPDIIDAASRPYSFTNVALPAPIAMTAPPPSSVAALESVDQYNDHGTTTVALGSYALAPPSGFGVVPMPPLPTVAAQNAPPLPRPAPKPLPVRPIAYTMHTENPDFMARPDY